VENELDDIEKRRGAMAAVGDLPGRMRRHHPHLAGRGKVDAEIIHQTLYLAQDTPIDR